VGIAIHTAIWIQLIISFYTLVNQAGDKVPSWVESIIWVMFSLFSIFGVWATINIKSTITRENGYTVLSLLSKSLLNWMIYFGLQRG